MDGACDGLRPVDRYPWEQIIRRARIAAPVKYLALMLATYSNHDGTRVTPGVERLALVMCVSERTVKRNLGELRELGFIERVKQGNRWANDSDEYRLTIPPNVLDLMALTPEETPESGGH